MMSKYLNLKKYKSFFSKARGSVSKIDLLINEVETLRRSASRYDLSLLKSKFEGRRCFIIGNGPSLKLSDVELLGNEYTFASNKIFLFFEQTQWRPTFYSVEDHLVLAQNISDIEAVEAKYKLFPHYPLELAPTFSKSIYFDHHFRDFYPGEPDFSTDFDEGLHWGSSIVYTQMQMACAMGFKEIYLIGVDYSYTEPEKKEGNVLTCEGEVNHFHKDYRKKGEKWFLPNLHHHEKAFTKAKRTVEKNGIKVFNATRGGKLEIFERVDLDSLF